MTLLTSLIIFKLRKYYLKKYLCLTLLSKYFSDAHLSINLFHISFYLKFDIDFCNKNKNFFLIKIFNENL